MKKPITIGVIAVIATILVTSAVDFSVIGAKPIDSTHLDVQSIGDEVITCPNGDTVAPVGGFVRYTEYPTKEGERGDFSMSEINTQNRKQVQADLWSGSIESNKFMLSGIGFANDNLSEFCGETNFERSIFTVWGNCGRGETIHFETDLGYSGTFTGNALCV